MTTLSALIVGHGRMGRLIEKLAPSYGIEITGIVTSRTGRADLALSRFHRLDIIFEFTNASAFIGNLEALCGLGAPLVVGTTGWSERETAVRAAVQRADIAAVFAPNFSVGANVLEAVAASTAMLIAQDEDYGAFVHEAHHAAKTDAPSGTAKALVAALERAGYRRPLDVSATRAGHIPGIHTVGFDGPSETITLTHSVRDRATFARGALHAARWVQGKQGWFTMRDVLGITEGAPLVPGPCHGR
ncbi:MAG: dihydrodipicolinate reductase [Luteitalea sp.]|nr:dihydrodipicolinate reductase [Luteitalea sp.]